MKIKTDGHYLKGFLWRPNRGASNLKLKCVRVALSVYAGKRFILTNACFFWQNIVSWVALKLPTAGEAKCSFWKCVKGNTFDDRKLIKCGTFSVSAYPRRLWRGRIEAWPPGCVCCSPLGGSKLAQAERSWKKCEGADWKTSNTHSDRVLENNIYCDWAININ